MVFQSLLKGFVQIMPKKLFQVKKFEGGVNNNSSPTDIADNELQKANNAIVSNTGKIQGMGAMLGAPSNDPQDQTLTFPHPGRNLFCYETDRDGDGTFDSAGVKNYVATSGTNGVDIKHWDDNDGWIAVATLGTANPALDFSFYDGVLRYSDANLSNNARGWWGFISRTHFRDAAGTALTPDSTADGSSAAAVTFPANNYSYNADLESPTRVLAGKLTGVVDSGSSTTTLTAATDTFVDMTTELQAAAAAGTHYVAVNLTDNQQGNALSATDEVLTTAALSGSADWDTGGGADAFALYPPAGGIGIDVSVTNSGGALPDGTYKFGASFIYDNGGVQESNVREAGGSVTLNASNASSLTSIKIKFHSAALASPAYNRRLTGARIYIKDVADKSKTYHLICDVNFGHDSTQGWRFSLDDDFEGGFAIQQTAAAGELLVGYRDLIYIDIDNYTSLSATTYASINGYRPSEPIDISYATSTTVDGVVYAGCIKQDGVVYPDRMIKCASPRLGIAYDVFPESNFIDIATNDGDRIIVLESFADKVLQFKKRTLFIVNYSEDVGDYIEKEYAGMGVTHPAHVFKTPHGIAFMNISGCFLYTGSELVNLTDKIDDRFDRSPSAVYSSNALTGNTSLFRTQTGQSDSNLHGQGLSYVIGDVDGDGMLSTDDTTMITHATLNMISLTEWQRYRADASGDMLINAYDSFVISNKMSTGEGTLTSGFPIPLDDEV